MHKGWLLGLIVVSAASTAACGGSQGPGAGDGTTCGAAGSATACTAETITSAPIEFITDLKADDSDVFFATQTGTIGKLPLAGGAPTTLGSLGIDDEFPGLTLDDQNVYFGGIGEVGSVPKAGGALNVLATNENPGTGFVGSGSLLVWSEAWTTINCSCESGVIHTMPMGGGPVQSIETGLSGLEALASDGENNYWVSVGDDSLKKAPLAGGAPITLATGQGGASSLVVSGSKLFWTIDNAQTATCGLCGPLPPPSATDSTIFEMSTAGGAVTTFAQGYKIDSIAVDGSNVYWFDSYEQTISTASIATPAPIVLATNEAVMLGPVVNDQAIYWVTGAGDIRRMAKNP